MATVESGVAGGISFGLTDEQRELRALAREFAEKEIRPRAAMVWRREVPSAALSRPEVRVWGVMFLAVLRLSLSVARRQLSLEAPRAKRVAVQAVCQRL